MSCTKNKKRFLFWEFEGEHDFKATKFGRFNNAINNSYFVTKFECKACGVQHIRNFVSENELLRNGISIEEIASKRNTLFE